MKLSQITSDLIMISEHAVCLLKVISVFLSIYLFLFYSLFKQNDHRVSYVQANVATVVVGDRVSTLLDHEAVPIPLIFAIKLLLYFACDIRKVTWLMALKSSQSGDNRMLNLVLTHVGPLNQYTLVGRAPKLLQRVLVIAGDYRYGATISPRDSKRQDSSGRHIYHVKFKLTDSPPSQCRQPYLSWRNIVWNSIFDDL